MIHSKVPRVIHILPPRFARVRYVGLFAPNQRPTAIARCRELLGCQEELEPEETCGQADEPPAEPPEPRAPGACPNCGQPALEWLEQIPGRRAENAFDSTRMPPKTELAAILCVLAASVQKLGRGERPGGLDGSMVSGALARGPLAVGYLRGVMRGHGLPRLARRRQTDATGTPTAAR